MLIQGVATVSSGHFVLAAFVSFEAFPGFSDELEADVVFNAPSAWPVTMIPGGFIPPVPAAKPILRDGVQMQSGDIQTGDNLRMTFNVALDSWVVTTPSPLTDAVLSEKAFLAHYKVRVGWEGDKCRRQDVDGNLVPAIEWSAAHTEYGQYPAEKILAGTRVPKNYETDIEDAFYKAEHTIKDPVWFWIDLGAEVDFNRIVIYQHPDVPYRGAVGGEIYPFPGCSLFSIYGMNTAPPGLPPAASYCDHVADIDAVRTAYDPAVLVSKTDVNWEVPKKYRYIGFRGKAASTLETMYMVSFEVYNMVDETARVKWDENGPVVDITLANDPNQTAIPSASDCQVTFVNVDGRYNPSNSSSPIYYTQQFDGRGSGVRQGVPVQVDAVLTGADGKLRGKRMFDGRILNDGGAGGPMAVQLDDENKEATIVCKGITSMLALSVDHPIHEGSFYKQVLQDAFARAGVPKQDSQIEDVWSGVQWISLGTKSPMDVLQEMNKAMPFLRVNDSQDPATIKVTNTGRSRADFDFSRFPSGTADGVYCPVRSIIHTSDGHTHLVYKDAGNNLNGKGGSVYRWDDRHSVADCELVWNSDPPPFYQKVVWRHIRGLRVFEYWSGIGPAWGMLRSAPLSEYGAGVLAYTNHGTFDGTKRECGLFMSGQFIFALTFYGMPPPPELWVWDTTHAFSTRVKKGSLPAVNTPYSMIGGNSDYLFFSVNTTALSIWNHGGDPVGAAYSLTARNYFSFGSVDALGANYDGRVRYYLDDDDLYALAQPLKATGTNRYEVWKASLAGLYAGTETAVLLGVLADDVGQDATDIFAKDGYVYVLDRFSLWVWDTAKAVSKAFDLGTAFNYFPKSQTYKDQYGYGPTYPKQQTHAWFAHQGTDMSPSIAVNVFGSTFALDCGSDGPQMDAEGRLWVVLGYQSAGKNDWTQVRAFSLSGQQMSLTPTLEFDLADGRVENMNIFDGAPEANLVSMTAAPYKLAEVPVVVWNQQDDITFEAGKRTTMRIPLNTPSGRGYGVTTLSRRYLTIAAAIQAPTDPLPVFANPIIVPLYAYGTTINNFSPIARGYTSQTDYITTYCLAKTTITGLQSVNNGAKILFYNHGVADVVLKNNDARSDPNKRFYLGADVTLAPKQSVVLYYYISGVPAAGWYSPALLTQNVIWDDPTKSVLATIEGVYRPVTFWALGDSAFLSVDNTGKGACLVTGCSITAKPIQQTYSNSPALEQKDEKSITLYRKKYKKDVSSPFTNDPTSLRDQVLADAVTRTWVSPCRLAAWWPTLYPGLGTLITHAHQGILNLPCEINTVTWSGFRTQFNCKQIPDRFVI